MIRISKKGDYAVFIMGFLAQRGAYPTLDKAQETGLQMLFSAQEISAQTRLQKSIVANLLKDLTRAGLLDSVRGMHGGYRLARDPALISLGQILAVVEGRFTLVDCTQAMASAHHVVTTTLLPLANPGSAAKSKAANPALPAATAASGPGLAAGTSLLATSGDHACRLEGHCPSRSPMRVLHERIQRLLDEIRLPELCGLAREPQTRANPNFATAMDRPMERPTEKPMERPSERPSERP